jgi:3',5'-cyclic AMP phosphodiesterase CpdA
VRVALISDSHGNAVGLRAALEDIERRGADLVVALGDMAQGGPQPTECLELLRDWMPEWCWETPTPFCSTRTPAPRSRPSGS